MSRHHNHVRAFGPAAGIGALAFAVVLASPSAANAVPSQTIDFSAAGYTLGEGSPAGQNGWTATAAPFDYALVDTSAFPDSGLPAGVSLQVSNAIDPDGTDYLRSPGVDPAGKAGAPGALFNAFAAEFTVASATGAVQDGLRLDVALDASSRDGGVVNLRHTDRGLEIGSYWVPEDATDTDIPDWRSAVFAVVDPAVPHTIRVEELFRANASDVVRIYVDDVLVTGCSEITSWEHYHALAGEETDDLVDEIGFRMTSSAPSADGIGYDTGLPAAPATENAGFLFDGISYGSYDGELASPSTGAPIPDATDAPDQTLTVDPASVAAAGGAITVSTSGFQPGEDVYGTLFPEGESLGWLTADAAGAVAGSLTVPADLAAGAHTVQLNGAASSCTAAGAVAVAAVPVAPTPGPTPTPSPSGPALAPTGPADATPALAVAGIGLAVGSVLFWAARAARGGGRVRRGRS
ncbi:hypothetical protein AAIB33_09450 [Microbacterium sp. AZCO]|uniref:hypothetical protein n=1 Tax=Microbacterium sp. AZCO TaxID=3142976 RepID=UPI0031F3F5FF